MNKFFFKVSSTPKITMKKIATNMTLAYNTRKIRDVATKPRKLEQIHESPTNHLLPEFFKIAYILKKNRPAVIRTPDLRVPRRWRYL